MAAETLTFDFDADDLFTVATDRQGRQYRVLTAAGGAPGNTLHYHLKPHRTDGKVARHRGRYVTASSPLLPTIEAIEAERRRRFDERNPRRDCSRFAEEEI